MHPRNIYLDSQRAIKHAEKNPYLVDFIRVDKYKKRFDAMDSDALRELSKTLLLEDFNLDVEFPRGGLVPTIPLRLNYILWLEDLLAEFKSADNSKQEDSIRGIDIGTGGSAIYALLAARKNKWHMVGTEINAESLVYARRNVQRNNLESKITIKEGKLTRLIGIVFDDEEASSKDIIYDFTMCNPPFFSSEEESRTRTDKRPPPPNESTGNTNELIVEGGETKFVSNMINESIEFKSRVKIFTTMVGVKAHMKLFINQLRQNQITNISVTEFVQGKTIRWGLAWSFTHKLNPTFADNKTSELLKSFGIKIPKPLKALVEVKSGFECLCRIVRTIFADLRLELAQNVLEENQQKGSPPLIKTLEYITYQNTWSHLRRRRREHILKSPLADPTDDESAGSSKKVKLNTAAVEEPNPGPKSPEKMQAAGSKSVTAGENSSSEFSTGSSPSASLNDNASGTPSLRLRIKLQNISVERNEIIFSYINGSFGPDGVHQLFQYTKNYMEKCEEINSFLQQ